MTTTTTKRRSTELYRSWVLCIFEVKLISLLTWLLSFSMFILMSTVTTKRITKNIHKRKWEGKQNCSLWSKSSKYQRRQRRNSKTAKVCLSLFVSILNVYRLNYPIKSQRLKGWIFKKWCNYILSRGITVIHIGWENKRWKIYST